MTDVNYDQSIKLDVENAGELQAKLMWCGSQKIDLENVKDGDVIEIKANKWLNQRMPLLVVLVSLVIQLVNWVYPMLFIETGVVLVMISLLIISITFGRNWWLKMES